MGDHIPLERVKESARVLRDLGGEVKERTRGMGHGINDEELAEVANLLWL